MKSKLYFALYASLGINLVLIVALAWNSQRFLPDKGPRGPLPRDIERIEKKLGLNQDQCARLDELFRKTGESFDEVHSGHFNLMLLYIDAPQNTAAHEDLLRKCGEKDSELQRRLFTGLGEIIASLKPEQRTMLREELEAARKRMEAPRPPRPAAKAAKEGHS